MGFFGDLKNKVTGGAATVQVQAPPVQRGKSCPIRITATAKANGKVNNVYLLVRAVEMAQIRDRDTIDGKSQTELVKGSRTSFETRIPVAGAQDLQNGQSYEWQAQLELPHNAQPSFTGQMINHVWEIQAGLDMPGNDPDSGWQPISVA
jgi:hypothetical protein